MTEGRRAVIKFWRGLANVRGPDPIIWVAMDAVIGTHNVYYVKYSISTSYARALTRRIRRRFRQRLRRPRPAWLAPRSNRVAGGARGSPDRMRRRHPLEGVLRHVGTRSPLWSISVRCLLPRARIAPRPAARLIGQGPHESRSTRRREAVRGELIGGCPRLMDSKTPAKRTLQQRTGTRAGSIACRRHIAAAAAGHATPTGKIVSKNEGTRTTVPSNHRQRHQYLQRAARLHWLRKFA